MHGLPEHRLRPQQVLSAHGQAFIERIIEDAGVEMNTCTVEQKLLCALAHRAIEPGLGQHGEKCRGMLGHGLQALSGMASGRVAVRLVDAADVLRQLLFKTTDDVLHAGSLLFALRGQGERFDGVRH
ncbi:hypothetical protein D3C76_1541810 [compost metagenome]